MSEAAISRGGGGVGMRTGYDRATEIIRDHWDRRARTFDHEIGHGLVTDEQRRAWLELLRRLAGRAPRRVLDVGCGTGVLALRMAELGHTVTGIDLSPEMIDRARRNAEEEGLRVDFRVGDAAALDWADETYDLVVARHLIWLLPDPERGVAEWLRVLRPEGRLALIEGKWAENGASKLANAPLASRVLERMLDAAAALAAVAGRKGGGYRKYRRVELQLPFSGGLPADRLVDFLEANSVHDVVVEPLMDPALWGERPKYPRYLAMGTRAPADLALLK
jgi:ubiquinone/menaquinone biosynthesis C-methylase UbiE